MAKRGRPPRFKNPEEMEQAIDAYLAHIVNTEKPITLSGMLLHMGIYCKNTFYAYKDREGFSIPVKRARNIIEAAYEERLHGNAPTGAIFALKNMGWTDKTVQERTGPNGEPLKAEKTVVVLPPKNGTN